MPSSPVLNRAAFQQTLQGQPTDLYTLQSPGGLRVAVCNFGARLVQVAVPDGQGGHADVALGYDSLAGYLQGQPSMGALIGRWAGRLREGRLTMPDGTVRILPTNSGPHHHHGGPRGSRFRVFAVESVASDAVVMSHIFLPADDGVPGTIRLRLRIAAGADNTLLMHWIAEVADAPSLLNLTGHTFFNLAGGGSTHGHLLRVPANRYVPLAPDLCPLGALEAVEGSPLDLRSPRHVGDVVAAAWPPLQEAGGLDHYLVLDAQPPATDVPKSLSHVPGMRLAAELSDPASARSMQVWSTAPGLQVYAGHGLQAKAPRDLGRGVGPQGWLWQPGDGLCLEPMELPDAPNHPAFGVRWLPQGAVVHGAIGYRFGPAGSLV